MKIAVLGTGMVGTTIGSKLVELGNEVKIGSRTRENEKAVEWVNAVGELASQGSFKDAASFGEIIFNCTAGAVSLDALAMAGTDNLDGKILIDVANPLVRGKNPSLVPSLSNATSLAEEIQKAYSKVKVIKTLNTMHCQVMVHPSLLTGEHDVFICGNDIEAKAQVKEILNSFGWESIVDLGDLTAARATEMLSIIWVPLFGVYHSPHFNFKVMTGK
jgi:predicted dinucleotide-binding enzyme